MVKIIISRFNLEKIVFSNPVILSHFADRPSVKKWVMGLRANLKKLKLQAVDEFVREVTPDDVSYLSKTLGKDVSFQNYNPQKVTNFNLDDLPQNCPSSMCLYRRGNETFVTAWR